MITVATYTHLAQADLARTRLADHGIKALIADESTFTIGYGQVTGGVRLQVAEADGPRALGILASSGRVVLPEDAEFQPDGTRSECAGPMTPEEVRAIYRRLFRAILAFLKRLRPGTPDYT